MSFQVCKETLSALNRTQTWILYNVFNNNIYYYYYYYYY